MADTRFPALPSPRRRPLFSAPLASNSRLRDACIRCSSTVEHINIPPSRLSPCLFSPLVVAHLLRRRRRPDGRRHSVVVGNARGEEVGGRKEGARQGGWGRQTRGRGSAQSRCAAFSRRAIRERQRSGRGERGRGGEGKWRRARSPHGRQTT